jgi:predicted dehydrogenase
LINIPLPENKSLFMIHKNVWLLGSGFMAIAYAKVLQAMNVNFITIGRGEKNAENFRNETGLNARTGGLEAFLSSAPELPEAVINATGIDVLASTSLQLLAYGVKNMLVEKPGVGYMSEMPALLEAARRTKANYLLGYNRRFYASVLKARDIIREEGGVTSMSFEFTEWSHTISKLQKTEAEWKNWFLGNSTHVIDTAFFLAGKPLSISCYVKGKGHLEWHPSSSIFAGAGETVNGALFSYHANWEAPGRWVLEISTKKHRLLFRPMESLQIQEIGSVQINPLEIDDSLDKQFKPGLYRQTKAFLEGSYSDLCNFEEQNDNMKHYKLMSGY